MCYIPPSKIERIEKSNIDLLDSEYKKQFSRVSKKKHPPHLAEIQKQSSLKATKTSSFESTTTDNTIVPNPDVEILNTDLNGKKESEKTPIKTLVVSSRNRDRDELAKSDLKEPSMEIPITLKNSNETSDKTGQYFYHILFLLG